MIDPKKIKIILKWHFHTTYFRTLKVTEPKQNQGFLPLCFSLSVEDGTITFFFKSVNTFLFSNNFSPQSALMRLYSHFPRFVPLLYISSLSQFLLMIHQSVPDILPNHISFDKTLFDRKNRPCFRMTRLYNVWHRIL